MFVEELTYNEQAKKDHLSEDHSKEFKLLADQIDNEGRIIYEDGTRGSYVIELLVSISTQPKVSKLIDEYRFKQMVKDKYKIAL